MMQRLTGLLLGSKFKLSGAKSRQAEFKVQKRDFGIIHDAAVDQAFAGFKVQVERSEIPQGGGSKFKNVILGSSIMQRLTGLLMGSKFKLSGAKSRQAGFKVQKRDFGIMDDAALSQVFPSFKYFEQPNPFYCCFMNLERPHPQPLSRGEGRYISLRRYFLGKEILGPQGSLKLVNGLSAAKPS